MNNPIRNRAMAQIYQMAHKEQVKRRELKDEIIKEVETNSKEC